MIPATLLATLLATATAAVFNVTDEGAVADGKTDCTAAIQKSIDRAEAAGGGTVKLPPASSPYLVHKTLVIRGDKVVLSGKGATIRLADGAANGTAGKRTTASQVHVLLIHGTPRRRVDSVRVLGLTIDANIQGQQDYYNPRALVVEFAQNVLIRDVTILRPFVGLDIGAGSRNCEVRNCVVTEWLEDGFDASGDADKGSRAITTNIRFINCQARNAPQSTGNAWEIEDGVRHIVVQDCLVENVPRGNGFGLRNHWKAGVIDVSRDVQLRRVTIRNVGGKYGIYGHSAPRDRYPDNRFVSVRLIDVTCDAPVLFHGPMEQLTIQGGRYGALFLGWKYDHSTEKRGEVAAMTNTTVRVSHATFSRIDVMADDARVSLFNLLIDGKGKSRHGVQVVGGTDLRISHCTISGTGTGVELEGTAAATLRNSIVWGNKLGLTGAKSRPIVDHCCLQDPLPETAVDRGGNLNTPPLFVPGPSGGFYLADGTRRSPCIDAGRNPAAYSGIDELTTRRDLRRDTGRADLGFHYPAPSPRRGPPQKPGS